MKRFLLLFLFTAALTSLGAQQVCTIGAFSYELEREGNEHFVIKITKPSNLTQAYNVYVNGEKQEHPTVINGGPFYYGPFPIDCSVAYELYIERIDNESCNITANIGQVCSLPDDCGFKDIRHEILACDGVELKLLLDFDPVNTNNLGFDLVAGNGDYLGFFLYEDLPVTFAYPYVDGAVASLFISDNDNDACTVKYDFVIDCEPNDECHIFDITYTVPECNPNGIVYVGLDFEYINVGESFTVSGNGLDYGTFSYADLPIKVGPILPQCDKEYEFVIRDKEKQDCGNYIDDVRICCPGECIEPSFEIVNLECTSDELFMKLELTSDLLYESLNIFINNMKVENYEIDWPYIKLIHPNLFTSIVNEITICQNVLNMECCYSQEFTLEDCVPNDQCKIDEIEYSFSECNDDKQVFMKLDFKYKNTGESFFVKGNGMEYGEFKYTELPIEIGPIQSHCELPFEIVIQDAQNPNCLNYLDNLSVCCEEPCIDPSFEIINIECSPDDLFIKVKLNQNFPVDPLAVTINGQHVDHFEVDYPYVYIHTANTLAAIINTLEICSPSITGIECCYAQEFSLEDCIPNDECKIYGLEFSYPECTGSGTVLVTLDFKYINVQSESFTVKGNGVNYGEFRYADLPIEIGPLQADCTKEYEFVVSDAEQPNCTAYIDGIFICCPNNCVEPGFEIVNMECENNEVSMKLELLHPLVNDDLRIEVNGVPVDTYEIDLPYIYLRFTAIFPAITNTITLCTSLGDMVCCYSQVFSIDDCGPIGDCKIGEISIETSDCTSTVVPHFIIDFDYAGVGDKGFTVKGNGHNYGEFKYEQLPIRIEASLGCDTFYEFVIIDNEYNNCVSAREFGHFCCDNNCSFVPQEIAVKCDDGIITEIGFFLLEYTDPIKEYEVFVNNELIGVTDDNNVFLEFETQIPLDPNQEYILQVCDVDCCVRKVLDVSDCESVPCSISSIQVTELRCADNGVQFVLDFKHEGTSSEVFDLYSLFGYFGTYEYADLPMKIEGFPRLGIGANILFVCDDDSFCCNAEIFNPPLCSPTFQDSDKLEFAGEDKKDVIYIKQNPTDQYLHLVSPLKDNEYRIFDGDGNIVKEFKASDFNTSENVSELESGLYFVQIKNQSGIKTEKLIIAK